MIIRRGGSLIRKSAVAKYSGKNNDDGVSAGNINQAKNLPAVKYAIYFFPHLPSEFLFSCFILSTAIYLL